MSFSLIEEKKLTEQRFENIKDILPLAVKQTEKQKSFSSKLLYLLSYLQSDSF